MTRKLPKFVLTAVLLSLLALGTLAGGAASTPVFSAQGRAPVTPADGCDTVPPAPGLDCPPAPTPTPKP